MKKVSAILSHLTTQPQFKSLKRHACYNRYLSLLGAKWQKAIAFVYIRNNTLFVAVKHPGFKMELNYNKDILKSILTQLSTLDKACQMLQAEKVVVFHSKYHPLPQKHQQTSTIPRYHELATADFTILSPDAELREKFETIRQHIQTETGKSGE